MSSTVRITWEKEHRYEEWHAVCAWAVEHFGLPGDKFVTRLGSKHLDFVFSDSRDALIMSIRWSAPIIDNNQVTSEFVSNNFL